MNAIGWGGKTLEQVRKHLSVIQMLSSCCHVLTEALQCAIFSHNITGRKTLLKKCFLVFQVYEDVSQCCQALSQRLGTQPYFFNKQYVFICFYVFVLINELLLYCRLQHLNNNIFFHTSAESFQVFMPKKVFKGIVISLAPPCGVISVQNEHQQSQPVDGVTPELNAP